MLGRNRLGCDRADAAGESVDVAFAVGMDAITEEDHGQVLLRVDPKGRPGKAAVSDGYVGKCQP